MNELVIASTRESAGKTSFIVGLMQALNKNAGYMKPFGDRLLYRKKRLWDYDSALIANIFGLKEDPENITLAFEHSKIRYMYDREKTEGKVLEMASNVSENKDMVVVEGGKDLSYGISVHLDAVSVAEYLEAGLLLVLCGDDDRIIDDITFVKKYVAMKDIDFKGVVITKVQDVKDFKDTYVNTITDMDVSVLGVVPYKEELTYVSVGYLAEFLFAKVLAGDDGLTKLAKNIFVGALSANAALRNPLFKKEDKLIITGGDRVDMILAALDSDTAGVILTNNVVPPTSTIPKAMEQNIPLLLVSSDTYQTAKQIDDLEPLLTKDDTEKIELLKNLVSEYVDIDTIME